MILNLRGLLGDNTDGVAFDRRKSSRQVKLLASIVKPNKTPIVNHVLGGIVVRLYSVLEAREYNYGIQDGFDGKTTDSESVAYRLGVIDGLLV